MSRFNKLTATAILLVAPLLACTVLASGASAAPGSTGARYQVITYTITNNNGLHFTATNNPCDGSAPGSFSGTGAGSATSYHGAELSITGTLSAGTLNATYVFTKLFDNSGDPGVVAGKYAVTLNAVVYSDGTFVGSTADNLNHDSHPIAGTITSTPSTYANHGDYVSSNGGTDSAAQSCIGQLIK